MVKEGVSVPLKWATITTLMAVIVYTITITRYITRLEGKIDNLAEKEEIQLRWIMNELSDHEKRLRHLENNR